MLLTLNNYARNVRHALQMNVPDPTGKQITKSLMIRTQHVNVDVMFNQISGLRPQSSDLLSSMFRCIPASTQLKQKTELPLQLVLQSRPHHLRPRHYRDKTKTTCIIIQQNLISFGYDLLCNLQYIRKSAAKNNFQIVYPLKGKFSN